MKTNEQIESAIVAKFANDVLGVSAIKEEHVNNQLSISDSELAVAAAKKAAAAAAYKKAENEYLLKTNLGDIQTNILQRAIKEFAELKEDFDFLLWVASNHKLQYVYDICTDTETRLMSFLNNTYANYISGKNAARKAASEKKAAKAAAKARLENADTSVLSDSEFEKMVAKMRADREKAKKAAAK